MLLFCCEYVVEVDSILRSGNGYFGSVICLVLSWVLREWVGALGFTLIFGMRTGIRTEKVWSIDDATEYIWAETPMKGPILAFMIRNGSFL